MTPTEDQQEQEPQQDENAKQLSDSPAPIQAQAVPDEPKDPKRVDGPEGDVTTGIRFLPPGDIVAPGHPGILSVIPEHRSGEQSIPVEINPRSREPQDPRPGPRVPDPPPLIPPIPVRIPTPSLPPPIPPIPVIPENGVLLERLEEARLSHVDMDVMPDISIMPLSDEVDARSAQSLRQPEPGDDRIDLRRVFDIIDSPSVDQKPSGDPANAKPDPDPEDPHVPNGPPVGGGEGIVPIDSAANPKGQDRKKSSEDDLM